MTLLKNLRDIPEEKKAEESACGSTSCEVPYFTFDKTFCTNSTCYKRVQCARWEENLMKLAERANINMVGVPISMSCFEPVGDNCEYFIEWSE